MLVVMENVLLFVFNKLYLANKLDGVGPVDIRPSNDKLNHFFKQNYIKN